MASVSRLGRQIEEIIETLNGLGARVALIGGLALASHKVIRATQDVDLLADIDLADRIDESVIALGYRCLHRSVEAANYLRGDERLDFLFASRPIARRLLAEAEEHDTAFGVLRVVGSEGLIGFKFQGLVNDPRRTQDLEDGSGGVVVAVHGEREPYAALDDLMCVVEAFCPVWPDRGLSRSQGVFLL